jgi:hypothetical protein
VDPAAAVSAAIERIRGARHASMPDEKCSSGESGTTLTVENGTNLLIRYLLKGPTSQAVTVEPSLSIKVTLTPGTYQVAAEIPNSSMMPFYGERTFNAGTQCRQLFYMSGGGAATVPTPAASQTSGVRSDAVENEPTTRTAGGKDTFTFDVRYTPSAMSLYKSGLLTISRKGFDLKRMDKGGLRDEFSCPCSELEQIKGGFWGLDGSFLIKTKDRNIRLYGGITRDELAGAIQQACSLPAPAPPPTTGSRPIAPQVVQQSVESAQQVKAPSDSPQVFDAIDGQVSVSSAGIQFRNLHKPKDSFTLTCAEVLNVTPVSQIKVIKIRTAARDYFFRIRGDPTIVIDAMKDACATR